MIGPGSPYKVVRYNLAESRFARLDRTQVLGRHFFSQVAPCTATPEFLGRFQKLVHEGSPGETDSFPDLFDFKFGAQQERLVSLPASIFTALRATGDRVNPRAWSLIIGDWGLQWGRLAMVDLETEAIGVSEVPRCELLAGYFRAIFCHIANKRLVVREVSCASQGHAHRTFVVVAQDRSAALEMALSRAEGDLAAVVAALRATKPVSARG